MPCNKACEACPFWPSEGVEVWHCQLCGWEGPSQHAVWGHQGRKHSQRREQPIAHGTVKGYQQERRRKMPTCPACRAAWRKYYQDRRGYQPKGAEQLRKLLKKGR